MSSFETHVVRHGDAAAPHYSVRFLSAGGESVTVEFHLDAGPAGDPGRGTVLDAAWGIVSRLAEEAPHGPHGLTPERSVTSTSAGLSRPVGETEADTHGSGGRDTGTA